MSKLSKDVRAELEAGVSQSRLAQIAGISSSTLRNYEKDGLIAAEVREGKKLYGLAAQETLEKIKRLRAAGLGLKDIAVRLGGAVEPSSPVAAPAGEAVAQASAAELMAKVEAMRVQLEAERAKLEQLAAGVQTRITRRRNELALSQRELEEIERLRESNVKRALEVTRRARKLEGTIRYATTKTGVIRLDLPQKPTRKR